MLPTIMKITRDKDNTIVFLNLNEMIKLRFSKGEDSVITMSNGDTYPLTAYESKQLLNTLYGAT